MSKRVYSMEKYSQMTGSPVAHAKLINKLSKQVWEGWQRRPDVRRWRFETVNTRMSLHSQSSVPMVSLFQQHPHCADLHL